MEDVFPGATKLTDWFLACWVVILEANGAARLDYFTKAGASEVYVFIVSLELLLPVPLQAAVAETVQNFADAEYS